MSDHEKKIHIFKRGRHVASNGAAIEFTDEMLAASAAAYDPAKHEAPLVIGHPKHDDPAYGWAKSVHYADGEMQIVPDQVDPQFAELHRAGRFKKRSASFYAPDAPNNPVPGVYYLRHVGFLGAQPPAVKGLKAANFADAESGVVEFADWTDMQNASLWRRVRDWIIGKDGLDEADKVIPSYAVESLEEAARKADAPNAIPVNYSEQEATLMKTQAQLDQEAADLKKAQDKLAADQLAFAEREAAIKASEEAARRKEIVEYVDGLVKAGKVLPRDQAGLVAYMAGANESGVIEFGEGDDKKSLAPNAWLKTFLDGLPNQVDYSERGAGKHEERPADAQSIANRALEFQESERKAGRTVSITAAVTHVTTQAAK